MTIKKNKNTKINSSKKQDQRLEWNLDAIYPVEKFDELLGELQKDLPKLDEYFLKLSPDMDEKTFREFMEFNEESIEKRARLHNRACLLEYKDQKSEIAKIHKSKCEDFYIKLDDAQRKIWHWIQGKEILGKQILDDDNAKRLFLCVPDLEYYLDRKRELAKHTLSENEESIITKKDMTGTRVLVDLRSMLETELKFPFKQKNKNKKKTFTLDELLSFRQSVHPCEREDMYKLLLSTLKEQLPKFFKIYQAVVKDWNYEGKIRGYKDAISIRNTANDVSDQAINNLLQVCSEESQIFQRYFLFKAKELGVEKLSRFDIYAPLKKEESEKIRFDEAIAKILDTFDKFNPRFAKEAKDIIDAGCIDSHPAKNKENGAFCLSIGPKLNSYIMTNFTGTTKDVFTLAHEFGHGIHANYSRNKHPSVQDPSLPLCETASTFAEMILFETTLNEQKNPKRKKEILSEKISNSYATVIRQNYFVKFELLAHQKIMDGIGQEELCDVYFNTLKEQFGDSISIDPLFKYEWSYIPHLVHTPFYCYAYSFGDLLSLSLYSRYKDEGKKFIPKLEKVLEYGGSKNPTKILLEIGIDINDKSFWKQGFSVIKGWQDELERL